MGNQGTQLALSHRAGRARAAVPKAWLHLPIYCWGGGGCTVGGAQLGKSRLWHPTTLARVLAVFVNWVGQQDRASLRPAVWAVGRTWLCVKPE